MKKYSLIISTILLVVLFIKLLSNYSERFDEVENNYLTTPKSAVNLVKGTSYNDLSDVLHNQNYITNKDDADFVSKFIIQKLEDGQSLLTLYDLNKRIWQMPVSLIDSIDSSTYKEKADTSRVSIGIDKEFLTKDISNLQSISDTLYTNQHGVINVSVKEAIENSKETRKCANVVVRLSQQYIDSLDNYKSKRRTIAYLKTNDKGEVSFIGLNPNLSYSVLPIKDGFEYGTSKGTIGGNLAQYDNATLKCSFTQQEHKIRIFDAQTLKQIKEDKTLTIRSPKEFKNILVKYVVLFFAAWWGLWIVCKIRRKPLNETILAILMSLTGLCLLTMFSLNDPLTDKLLGVDMGNGILCGVAIILVMQLLDIRKFYQGLLSFDIGKFSIFIPSIVFSIIIFAVGSFYVSKNIMLAISVLLMFITFFAYKIDKEHLTNLLKRQDVEFDIPVECIKWIFKPFKDKICYFIKILADDKINIINKLIALIGMLLCTPLFIIDLMEYSTSFLSKILIDSDVNKILKFLSVLGIIVLLPYVLCKILYRKLDKLPKGAGYLLTALMLTALLFTPLGVAVGGMKVNLNIGILFQPSEIAKYLIIFFMAAYFSINANKIVQYSEKGNAKLFGAKLRMMMSIFIGLGLLMGLYLVLGDMGPALVLAFTFIILYSVIKSKVDLEGITSEDQLKKIFTCDFAMLVYGVISFTLFLYIGSYLGNMGIFCIAWFVVWIIWGITKQQIHETPIFFNFIVAAFIFGGSLLDKVPGLGSVAERLDSRNEMCSNTWGTLPIDGNIANAGENTQVAEGLWGLASGGLWGQGLGNGSTHFIPAFHTDMILESIGEQMGFVGIFIIILLLVILLRRTIVVGYETSHPFTFYLCLGIAIVTAIQFVIISLGSTGIIPLTGVTVPFLSYGKVSMILNLAAFGIILSIASHSANETTKATEATASLIKQNIGKYNYSVSLLSWTYCIFAIFICGVFFYYQFINRNDTLIRPVYVNNSSGIPIVEYNPRIEQLTQKMHSGDIYDRNGVLLASSDPSKFSKRIDEKNPESKTQFETYKEIFGEEYNLDLKKRQKRYYPFGDHLAFMLGNRNSNLFVLNGSESSGYVAETRHLSELRGYNTRLDENGEECPTVILSTDSMQIDRWHSANYKYKDTIKLLNYSALIPYMKHGVNSERVRDFNDRDESWWNIGKIKPKDIHLTIDAALQTKLQKDMEDFVDEICSDEQYSNIKGYGEFKKYRNLIRASVVVLDAENGDLLASANYPLPSSERLENEIVEKNGKKQIPVYSDKGKAFSDWTAYTDVDLGLFYANAPGSTAKVISALAGLKKLGTNVANSANSDYSYYVLESQKVGAEPTGRINMSRAIVESSNCYFINLINDYELYDELSYLYRTTGIAIGGKRPYNLFYSDSTNVREFYKSFYDYNIEGAISKYRSYVENNDTKPMQDAIWQWTWGQGNLDATPLSMAKVASIVANNGVMATTRYTAEDESLEIPVVKPAEALSLGRFMIEEAETHGIDINLDNNVIGGKTGTANRHIKKAEGTEIRSSDAWYICYVKHRSNPSQRPIAIAARIERGQNSTFAKLLVKKKVLETLTDLGYIYKD